MMAVVFQAIGLAAMLEAERCAESLAFAMPTVVGSAALEVVAVSEAGTLAGMPAGFRFPGRVLDVFGLVPRAVALAAARAGAVERGACRRARACRADRVRALRVARIASLEALLVGAYASCLAMDSDSVACGSLEGLLRLADDARVDVAVRPAPAAIAKGPAALVPVTVPEPNGGLLLLRNTSKTRRVLGAWRAIYDGEAASGANTRGAAKHPTSDQPALRAAIFAERARYRTLDRLYGCPAWVDKAARCAAYAPGRREARDLRRKRDQKLNGANGALWRAHVAHIMRGDAPCLVVHGAHLRPP